MKVKQRLEKWTGPHVSASYLCRDRRFLLSTLFLGLAAICLVTSIFLPYWKMTMFAPQYPGGLQVKIFANQITGDVQEINGLNHYIGMRPLGQAAKLERKFSIFAISLLALLLIAAIYVHNRRAALLSLPALLFPGLFMGDLYFWLWNFGTHLDPKAPLSSSVEPFVPDMFGKGLIGQFKTVGSIGPGFYLAVASSILILVGLYFHRKVYKPLVEEGNGHNDNQSSNTGS